MMRKRFEKKRSRFDVRSERKGMRRDASCGKRLDQIGEGEAVIGFAMERR